ncbi:DUF6468 domain-containing protein [Phenylobacterium sp.]|jgi:hypothetical protein|uniref:DUF6468 domain-containing protein n=1 Tax=Phenylobacterium sp. TaxID=1871053 RepID=UPI003784205D
MSVIAIGLNMLLAGLLGAALLMGWRLNKRLQTLRDSHEGFGAAVRDLNAAAIRAEQGLAELRAASDEAAEVLADRIRKGRDLAAQLDRLVERAPAVGRSEGPADDAASQERRLGALLAAAREARPSRATAPEPRAAQPWARPSLDDDLFDDEPLTLTNVHGGRR